MKKYRTKIVIILFFFMFYAPCVWGAYIIKPNSSFIIVSTTPDSNSFQYKITLNNINATKEGQTLTVTTEPIKNYSNNSVAFKNFERLGGFRTTSNILTLPLIFTARDKSEYKKGKGYVTFSSNLSKTESYIHLNSTEKNIEISLE